MPVYFFRRSTAMLEKVNQTIINYQMIKENDRILVGVSGGVDSVVLLDILVKLRSVYNLTIFVAHLNHGLRGRAADEDEAFVVSLAEKYNARVYTKKEDMLAYAELNKISSEEAGRVLRYAFFEEIMQKENIQKIAIAHNKNDQAETILMRIMRGTGLDGMVGIKPVNGSVIRPLLFCSRAEIEAFEYAEKLNHREDDTNKENIYTRNTIRNQLIPQLENLYNPNLVEGLSRMGQLLADDLEIIENQLKEILQKIAFQRQGKMVSFNRRVFLDLSLGLKRRVLRHAIHSIQGDLANIEEKHIHNMIQLISQGKTGKEIHLTNGWIAKNNYDFFEISQPSEKYANYEFELEIGKKQSFGTFEIETFVEDKIKIDFYTKDIFLKFFDYDRIKSSLKVRNRRPGDRIVPLGMKGSKKIKDLFIDEKVASDKRSQIPLIVCGDEIVWVVGYRIGDRFKVSEQTKRVLVVKYNETRSVQQ